MEIIEVKMAVNKKEDVEGVEKKYHG